jgi:pyrimidine-nucleoside phosphorylase
VACTLALGVEMLIIGGAAEGAADARAKLLAAISSGAGAEVMARMIAAQHGDPAVITDPDRLPRAPEIVTVFADQEGYISGIDSLEIGLSAVALGAGRTRADQAVDPAVGVELAAARGAKIARGEPLARIHARRAGDADAVAGRVLAAFRIEPEPVAAEPLVLERIQADE